MAKYRLYKNNNRKSAGYGKYYARKASEGLMELDGLIEHMAGHNSAYSVGTIKGVIADLVSHVRELAYEGKSVKIDNLGIFRVSMKSKGVEDPKEFNAATDITSKWQVQPTGAVVGKSIDVTRAAGAVLTWEELGDYSSPRNAEGGGE
jgi:predicted histone-like DNA-binding protein